jgi:receptor expression-enhancing protein 5/6
MAVAATITLLYTMIYSLLAYILPGYQTFKAIERRGTEDVRQWAVYWVVLAVFYCSQVAFDLLLSWLPLYYAGKLAFILALWHPNTQLAQSIYIKVFRPMLNEYEADIDKAVMDLRTKATDLVGQQASNVRTHARQLSGQATVMLKNIQQKAADRAKAARGPGAQATAGHGLHTE